MTGDGISQQPGKAWKENPEDLTKLQAKESTQIVYFLSHYKWPNSAKVRRLLSSRGEDLTFKSARSPGETN